MKTVFLSPARAELAEAVSYYNTQSEVLDMISPLR